MTMFRAPPSEIMLSSTRNVVIVFRAPLSETMLSSIRKVMITFKAPPSGTVSKHQESNDYVQSGPLVRLCYLVSGKVMTVFKVPPSETIYLVSGK